MPEDGTAGGGQADADVGGPVFRLFNEIGIIGQLSRALFEKRLPDGIILPQFSVLNHLVRLGNTPSPLALARAFQVPKTSMTHTLAGLEARGLIEMRPNPEDGRSKLVHLTEAGRAVRNAAIADLTGAMASFVDELGAERIAALVPELERIRVYLDNNRDL